MSMIRSIYKRGDRQDRPVHVNQSPTMTQKHFRDEVNINKIMDRFHRTGVSPIDPARAQRALYADVSEIGDYRGVCDRIWAAEQAFSALPAKVRTRFGNQPEALVEWLRDPKNHREAIELGLMVQRKPDPATKLQDTLSEIAKNTAPPSDTAGADTAGKRTAKKAGAGAAGAASE